MAIGNLPPGLVAFPDDLRVVLLEPAFARVVEWRVPTPGVDTGNAHAARGEIKRRFAAHAATGSEIFVSARTTCGAGVHQHDVEGFQRVADALELRLHFSCGHHMAVRYRT